MKTLADQNRGRWGPRPRILILSLLVLVILLGLASRKFPSLFSEFFVAHAGDVLWTVAAYVALAFVFPAWTPLHLGIAALTISFAVEFSQLLDWRILHAIRGTTLGHLVLGNGFVGVDFVRYLVGAASATSADYLVHSLSALKRGPQG